MQVFLRQKVGCCGSCFALLLQWYTLTALGVVAFLAKKLYDIITHDYLLYNYLDPDTIRALDGPPYAIPGWLRRCSLISPLVASAAFVIVALQSMMLVVNSIKVNRQKYSGIEPNLSFRLASAVDQLLVIIGVPLVFILGFMSALIRQWEVMTGSYDKGVTKPELSVVCTMDMRLAMAFQYFAMWKFARLCAHFMYDARLKWVDKGIEDKDLIREYETPVKWASLLGVHAFVVIGFLRICFDMSISIWLFMHPDSSEAQVAANGLVKTVESNIGVVFAFATVLCVVNMFMISDMLPLRKALGKTVSVNIKFHGTRLLLLVAQIQPGLLDLFTVESRQFQSARNFAKSHKFTFLDDWTFNADQSKLLNITLILLVWCPCVSILNAFSWEVDYEHLKEFSRISRTNDKESSSTGPPPSNGSLTQSLVA